MLDGLIKKHMDLMTAHEGAELYTCIFTCDQLAEWDDRDEAAHLIRTYYQSYVDPTIMMPVCNLFLHKTILRLDHDDNMVTLRIYGFYGHVTLRISKASVRRRDVITLIDVIRKQWNTNKEHYVDIEDRKIPYYDPITL